MIHLDSTEKEEKEVSQDKTNYDSLEKLSEVTVNLGDDEDMNEPDDEEESGDWYPDYETHDKVMRQFKKGVNIFCKSPNLITGRRGRR